MINSENIYKPWPKSDIEFLGSCPICRSTQRNILYAVLHDRVFFCAPGAWTLFRCNECSCVYLDPRPSQKSMSRAYTQYYTHDIQYQENLLNRIKQSLENGYLNSKWRTSLSPASKIFGQLLPKSIKASLEGGVMRHLPRLAGGRKLLDVGCGSGLFLLFAKNAGWQTTGFDLDPNAVETARSRDLDVHVGGFETLEQENDYFDVITVSHVIEHVYNPKELLDNCYRLLKPGGYFWIETPNIESYGHFEFKEYWRGLEPPRHLQLLSWSLLQQMLDESGFLNVTQAAWRPEYLNIYCASKAIKYFVEQENIKPTFINRIKSHLVESKNKCDYKRRECITLHATKSISN